MVSVHRYAHLTFWFLFSPVPCVVGGLYLIFVSYDFTRLLYTCAVMWFASHVLFGVWFLAACVNFYVGDRSAQTTNMALNNVCHVLVMFNGFFISHADAPPYWLWAFDINLYYRLVTSMVVINFSEQGAEMEAFLLRLNYDDINVAKNVLALFGTWIACLTMAAACLYADASQLSFRGTAETLGLINPRKYISHPSLA